MRFTAAHKETSAPPESDCLLDNKEAYSESRQLETSPMLL